MRPIKFRAKVETGEWAIGSLIYDMSYDDLSTKNNSQYYIQERFSNAISLAVTDENTIGQYTGLKDNNGKEIYEGDIVRFCISVGRGNDVYENRVVVWDEEYARFLFADETNTIDQYYGMDDAELAEVIGNIHDNPELMGVKTW